MKHIKGVTRSEIKSELEERIKKLEERRDVLFVTIMLGFLGTAIAEGSGTGYGIKIFGATLIPVRAYYYSKKRIEANEIYLRCINGDDEE